MYSLGAIHALSKDKKLIKLQPRQWKNVMGLYGKPKPYALEVVKRLMPKQFEKMIDPYPNRVDRAEPCSWGWPISSWHYRQPGEPRMEKYF